MGQNSCKPLGTGRDNIYGAGSLRVRPVERLTFSGKQTLPVLLSKPCRSPDQRKDNWVHTPLGLHTESDWLVTAVRYPYQIGNYFKVVEVLMCMLKYLTMVMWSYF